MGDERDALIRVFEAEILDAPATLDAKLRRALAQRGGTAPDPLAGFAGKIHEHAYQVVDGDIAALQAAGYSEDQIFEASISAAVGAGLERLESALRAIEGAAK